MMYFPAVVWSAWIGGLSTGIVSVILSAGTAVFVFVLPTYSLTISHSNELWSFAIFLVVGCSISLLGERQRRAKDNSEHSARDAHQKHELLLTTMRSIGDAVIVTDAQGCILLMWTEQEVLGQRCEKVFNITNEMTGERVESPIGRVLSLGVTVGLANHTILTARDGSVYYIDDSGAPIRDVSGTLQGVVLVFRDITKRKQEETARLFLTEASAILASSLDYEQTLQKVADLAVPHIADWCAVDMLDDRGTISQLAVAHVDPEKVKWAHELRKIYPPDPMGKQGLPNVLRTGKSEMYADIPEEVLVASARDAQRLAIIQQIGFRSVLIVPIIARERILGAITFVTTKESGRNYTTEDLILAEGLASRAALAIDNARLYRESQTELMQRRQVQDALRASEERFRFALANSDIAVYMMDRDLRYTWVYNGKISGEQTPLYGKTDGDFLEAEEAELLTEIKRRVLQTGVEERHIVRATITGQPVTYYDTLFAPLHDSDGNIIGITGTVNDITERKKVQDSLTAHQAEIESLNVRLQRSMRETHHRVKNNLQVITALVNLQEIQYEENIPVAEMTRLMQHIRSLASIHDLLTHQAQTDAEVSEVTVRDVMDKLLPSLQAMVGDRTISFTVQDLRLPVRLSSTFAVLVNELVSNALKHGSGKIHVSFRVQDDTAILTVTDEGTGFPEGFDPVSAANTGLDLIDSLSRVDLGGDVRYENQTEGGARVVIEFPVPSLVKTPGEE
jgi:PAS domain S-box-containing protein